MESDTPVWQQERRLAPQGIQPQIKRGYPAVEPVSRLSGKAGGSLCMGIQAVVSFGGGVGWWWWR